MPATTRGHAGRPTAVLREAVLVLPDPSALSTAPRVCAAEAERRDRPMVGCLRGRQCTMTGLVLRVAAREPPQGKTLASQRWLATTAVAERRADQLRQAVLLCLPRSGVAQAAKMPGLSDPAEGWLVCYFCWLLSSSCWSSGAVGRWSGRSGPSGPQGRRGPPSGRWAASIAATASALRAGSHS
jgi:hypothetical protein